MKGYLAIYDPSTDDLLEVFNAEFSSIDEYYYLVEYLDNTIKVPVNQDNKIISIDDKSVVYDLFTNNISPRISILYHVKGNLSRRLQAVFSEYSNPRYRTDSVNKEIEYLKNKLASIDYEIKLLNKNIVA